MRALAAAPPPSQGPRVSLTPKDPRKLRLILCLDEAPMYEMLLFFFFFEE